MKKVTVNASKKYDILIEKGLIEKQSRIRNNGGSSSNLYRLTDIAREGDKNDV